MTLARGGRGPRNIVMPALALLGLSAPLALAQDAATGEPEENVWTDQVISPEDLAPLPPDPSEDFDASGLPRSFRAELLASRTERGDDAFNEVGLSLGGFRETASLGNFSLDATLLRADGRPGEGSDIGGTATLWQRGLYLDGGWRGNNGLGVLNTLTAPLLREQFRFFLPSVPLAGASTEWIREGDDLQFQASLGRAGVFSGARVVGFELADGNVASLSGQWRWGEHWRAAIAGLATDGRIVPDSFGGSFYEDGSADAMHSAIGWSDADRSVNVNLQASDGSLGSAWGSWVDARQRRGRYTHHYGVFNLEPGLAWGAQPINNDSRGAYYRIAYQHARWSWSGGLDRIASVSGDSFDGWYATGFARYQASPRLGYGGSLAVRDPGRSRTIAGQWFVDQANAWGQSRLQLDHRQSSGRSFDDDSWQLSLEQTLPLRQGRRLAISAAYGELAFEDEPAVGTYSLSAYGGLDVTSRLKLDGTLRWTERDGSGAYRGVDANLSLAWRVATRWWLVGTFYENRGSERSPFIIDPLATEQPFVSLPRDRAVFLSLRYERQAGTSAGVLGGQPGTAAGSITGSVFLDENGDGERAASELPAANVTVVLDGRFAVRTDSQGNFEFARVAVGSHQVVVVPDNLPLPWFIDEQDDRRTVNVVVRESSRVDIGARRQR